MLCPRRGRALVSTAAAAAVLGAGAARGSGPTAVERPDPTRPCSAQLVPSAVTAGRAETRILVETDLSAARGLPEASAPAGSGIRIVDVRSDVAPGSWILVLDLTDARAGSWRISLRGDGYRCGGELEVREPVRAESAERAAASTRFASRAATSTRFASRATAPNRISTKSTNGEYRKRG